VFSLKIISGANSLIETFLDNIFHLPLNYPSIPNPLTP